MKSMRRITVKKVPQFFLCDSSIFNTFLKTCVMRNLCDKAIFACVIGISCVIKHFSQYEINISWHIEKNKDLRWRRGDKEIGNFNNYHSIVEFPFLKKSLPYKLLFTWAWMIFYYLSSMVSEINIHVKLYIKDKDKGNSISLLHFIFFVKRLT